MTKRLKYTEITNTVHDSYVKNMCWQNGTVSIGACCQALSEFSLQKPCCGR